jgi:dihydrofolate synthase/folylpolyglutamate synthase
MRRLDQWQGSLHRNWSSVLVAGTNGKGSVAWKIAAAMQKTGLKVGLYTSPHISTFRERIQVNGEFISEEFVAEYLPELFSLVSSPGWAPTFFELLTALAFAYFEKEEVDLAVLEVGLGGRLDATNVVDPILSVITSIERDHCELLGFSLDEIAYEKAGIVRPGVPVVVGPRARFAPILKAASDRLFVAPSKPGFYDLQNSEIARCALNCLGVAQEVIELGISVRPPCRFELIAPRPILLDVAHNPDGFAHLRQAIEEFYPERRFHVVLGLGGTKDLRGCLHEIKPIASRIGCYSNGHPRLRQGNLLAQEIGSDLAYCLSDLSDLHSLNEPLLICGSFLIMDDARRSLQALS